MEFLSTGFTSANNDQLPTPGDTDKEFEVTQQPKRRRKDKSNPDVDKIIAAVTSLTGVQRSSLVTASLR